MNKPSREALLAEIAELRARLEEEEETLRAIRNGEVDALVISGPEGERVYTLKGADHSYRILVETINEGAATLTPDGTIFYANRKLAQMLNLPLERLITSPIVDYIALADRAWFEALLSQGKQGESRGEVRLQAADGALVPAYLSLSSLKLEDLPNTVCLAVTDLTEQKRQEAILAEEQLSRAIFEQAEAVIVVVDPEGRIIRASHEAHRIYDGNVLLRRFDEVFRLATIDTSGNKSGPAAYRPFSINPILQGRIFHGLEVGFYPPEDGEPLEMLLNAGPLRGSQGEVLGAVVALTDITERKRAEAEREALLADIQTQAEELQASNEELASQTEELALQAEELQRAHGELEQKVKDRTAELRLTVTRLQEEVEKRQQTEESLQDSGARLRHLASKLLTAHEDERGRLALELHDELGQSLAVLKMQLRAIQRKAPPESSETRESLEHSLNFINEIIERIRRLSRNLRPTVLDEMGLTSAVEHLFREFCQDIEVTLDLDDTKELLPLEAQLNIYRIFQESFSNITKYAQATLVSVGIKRQEANVVFQIEDNGRGFDYQKVINENITDRGLGLTAMDERARMLGGSLNIWSQEGQGTKITLIVPIQGR